MTKNFRSAGTGRFVTPKYAASHKSTTVGETRGGGSTGGTYRSASSGRFVKSGYGKSHPKTTVKDS
jgi:hypothetical protein